MNFLYLDFIGRNKTPKFLQELRRFAIYAGFFVDSP